MIPKGKRRTLASRKTGKGRSRGQSGVNGFVQLHRYMLESLAWLSLSAQSRSVYVELERRYKGQGQNNGRIPLSAREAAERCGISRNTAPRCFAELADRGFIECVKLGRFSMKIRHASEWRLTIHRCDVTGDLPTKAFMRWRPPGFRNLEPDTKGEPARAQCSAREAA